MAGLRCPEVQARPRECLDGTSVTLAECPPRVPPCAAACPSRMAGWRMEGKPRTARRLTVYQNCPLPPPAERLCFLLTDLQTDALQVGHGRRGGMVPGQATQWRQGLLPALRAALRPLG